MKLSPTFSRVRAMGAGGGTIAAIVLGESLALVAFAAVGAGGLVALGAWGLQTIALPGIAIDGMEGFVFWFFGLAAALSLAVLATIPVLWRSMSIDVAAQLSSR